MKNSYYNVALFDEELTGRFDTKHLKYQKDVKVNYDDSTCYDKLGKYMHEIKNPAKFVDGVEYKFYDTSVKSVNEKGQFVNYQIITNANKPRRAKQVAVVNTIIVANLKTNRGKACIVTEKEAGSIVSSGYLMIKPNQNLNIDYLQAILQSQFALYYLRQIASTGLGMANWSYSDLAKIRLHVPSIAEQQRTLPLVQEKIKVLENMIKELEEKKKKYELQNKIDEVFQDVLDISHPNETLDRYYSFGDYSIISYNEFSNCGTLDVFSNYKFSLQEQLTKKYHCKKLKDVTSLVMPGRDTPKPINNKTSLFRVQTKDMIEKDGNIDYKHLDNMKKEDYDSFVEKKIEKNDIILAIFGSGAIGRVVYSDRDDINAVLGNHLVGIIRANENTNSRFLFYYLYSFIGQQQIFRCVTGTTGQISLSIPRVRKILVPELDSDTQELIINKIESYGNPNELNKRIQFIQSIIDDSLNKYILNGYSDDLFELPKEDKE